MNEEFKVTVYMTHIGDWGKQCDHIEYAEPNTLEEAIRLAMNWPMSSGYELVKAIVETREVSDYREVFYHEHNR